MNFKKYFQFIRRTIFGICQYVFEVILSSKNNLNHINSDEALKTYTSLFLGISSFFLVTLV